MKLEYIFTIFETEIVKKYLDFQRELKKGGQSR